MFIISINQLPHMRMTAAGHPSARQPLTSDNVVAILEHEKIRLRMNVMLNRFEFAGVGVDSTNMSQEAVYMALEDTLTLLDIGNLSRLPDMLNTIAMETGAYHPMEDWLVSKKWDGTDRLGELAATVPTESRVWPEYLRKWLIQAVEGVRGWRSAVERSLPHVLVFVGGQGAGKGRWLRRLAPGFVMADAELHLSSYGSKDQQLQALRYPVVELGEIDSTFKKSEVSALKSFLSRPVDSLRAPYARKAVDRPRMTTFAGSVNSMVFLNDPTGARRFWPVALNGGAELNWDHGIDMQQVFAQANHYWEAEMEDYCLEDDTEAMRQEEVQSFVLSSAGADLVSHHYYKYCKDFGMYAAMNKTAICHLVGAGTHPATLADVTEWLYTHLGTPRKIDGMQRCWAFPVGSEGINQVSTLMSEKTAKELFLQKPVKSS